MKNPFHLWEKSFVCSHNLLSCSFETWKLFSRLHDSTTKCSAFLRWCCAVSACALNHNWVQWNERNIENGIETSPQPPWAICWVPLRFHSIQALQRNTQRLLQHRRVRARERPDEMRKEWHVKIKMEQNELSSTTKLLCLPFLLGFFLLSFQQQSSRKEASEIVPGHIAEAYKSETWIRKEKNINVRSRRFDRVISEVSWSTLCYAWLLARVKTLFSPTASPYDIYCWKSRFRFVSYSLAVFVVVVAVVVCHVQRRHLN